MSQPGATLILLLAALWLGSGLAAIRVALHNRRGLRLLGTRGVRAEGEVARGLRREGTTVHPGQVRYQAGPAGQTYRRAPLNADHVTLEVGAPVVVRYDPEDPRRVVVERTHRSMNPDKALWSGVGLCLFGVGVAVWAFV